MRLFRLCLFATNGAVVVLDGASEEKCSDVAFADAGNTLTGSDSGVSVVPRDKSDTCFSRLDTELVLV